MLKVEIGVLQRVVVWLSEMSEWVEELVMLVQPGG